MMCAALHHSAHIEVVSIQKTRNRDAKQILRTEFLRQHTPKEILFPVARSLSFALATASSAARAARQILSDQLPRFLSREADAVGQEIKIGRRIDKPRYRRRSTIVSIGDCELMVIRVRAGQWQKIVLAKQA